MATVCVVADACSYLVGVLSSGQLFFGVKARTLAGCDAPWVAIASSSSTTVITPWFAGVTGFVAAAGVTGVAMVWAATA